MIENSLQESLLAAQDLASAMNRYMIAANELDLNSPSDLIELEDAAYNVMDAAQDYRLSL